MMQIQTSIQVWKLAGGPLGLSGNPHAMEEEETAAAAITGKDDSEGNQALQRAPGGCEGAMKPQVGAAMESCGITKGGSKPSSQSNIHWSREEDNWGQKGVHSVSQTCESTHRHISAPSPCLAFHGQGMR